MSNTSTLASSLTSSGKTSDEKSTDGKIFWKYLLSGLFSATIKGDVSGMKQILEICDNPKKLVTYSYPVNASGNKKVSKDSRSFSNYYILIDNPAIAKMNNNYEIYKLLISFGSLPTSNSLFYQTLVFGLSERVLDTSDVDNFSKTLSLLSSCKIHLDSEIAGYCIISFFQIIDRSSTTHQLSLHINDSSLKIFQILLIRYGNQSKNWIIHIANRLGYPALMAVLLV